MKSRLALVLVAVLSPACRPDGLKCGQGTHAEAGYCVADEGGDGGDSDSGVSLDTDTGSDSGADSGTDTSGDSDTAAMTTIAADLLIDAESGEVGELVTTAILDAGTHGASLGTWSLSAGCTMEVGGDEVATLAAFDVDGTRYDDIGSTRSFRFPNAGGENNNYAELLFDPRIEGDLSFGAWWSSPPDNSTWVTLDQVFFENSAGDWVVAQTQTNELFIHTRAGVGDPISFEYDTWYWLTFTVLRDAEVTLNLYDSSGALVGTSTLDNPGTQPWRDMRLGRTDNHGNGAAMDGDIRFDDLVLDISDATFPLGPR